MADINMLVMNGEDMIDRMQAATNLKDIPVVVISTEGSQTRIRRLQDKGVRFVHKSFTPEIIRDTVKEVLGNRVFDDISA